MPLPLPLAADGHREPRIAARRGPGAVWRRRHGDAPGAAGRGHARAGWRDRKHAAAALRDGDLGSGDADRSAACGAGERRHHEGNAAAPAAGGRSGQRDPRNAARRRPVAPAGRLDRCRAGAALGAERLRHGIDAKIAAVRLGDADRLPGHDHAARPRRPGGRLDRDPYGAGPGPGRALRNGGPGDIAAGSPGTAGIGRDCDGRRAAVRPGAVARRRHGEPAALGLRHGKAETGDQDGAGARAAGGGRDVVTHSARAGAARAGPDDDPARIGGRRPGAHRARGLYANSAGPARRRETLRRIGQLQRAVGRRLRDVGVLIVQLDHSPARGRIRIGGRHVVHRAIPLAARRATNGDPCGVRARRPGALARRGDGQGAAAASRRNVQIRCTERHAAPHHGPWRGGRRGRRAARSNSNSGRQRKSDEGSPNVGHRQRCRACKIGSPAED